MLGSGQGLGLVAGQQQVAQPGLVAAPVVQAPPPAVPLTPAQVNELTRNVLHLTSPDHATKEAALLELSKKREDYPDLAPMLWHSFGTITALLQEIIAIYPALSPPTLTGPASNRVCNALALLQCVASHPETRSSFLSAHIPLYLYPFLNTAARSKPFEYLRLTSLGVIGALVKVCFPRRLSECLLFPLAYRNSLAFCFLPALARPSVDLIIITTTG
jgi:Cell differentiation family, Rcd1-like